MTLSLSPTEFDDLVGEALDRVPAPLMDLLDNVVFLVEDEPEDGPPDLLGLYDGVPLTERGWGDAGLLPDRIYLFRGPLTRWCPDRATLVQEIQVTVVHEIAHHFGLGDDRLHELGWG